MAAIGPRNTKPEIAVRRALHRHGLRFSLHRKDLPGKPDIVLSRHRALVFVHGCFWHHHGCKNSVWPKIRAEFWRHKITGNIERDKRRREELKALGWRVFVVWECDAYDDHTIGQLISKIFARPSQLDAG